MSQEIDGEDMRPEYEIRGERRKYFEQYTAARLRVLDSPWVHPQGWTESRGKHPSESTIRIGAQPLYQSPRIGVPVTQ